MRTAKFLACLLPLLAGAAHAQDPRSVKSPDGQLEFRIFSKLPDGELFNCLAYQVWLRGKPLLDTSFLGLVIHDQEPVLGENTGLSRDTPLHEAGYNGIWLDYYQVSTTGKRIQIEVRVWNDGVAFRYTVPVSPLLYDLNLEDDTTQFRFPKGVGGLPDHPTVPYVGEVPGQGWVGIYESTIAGFPKAQLMRFDERTLAIHLPEMPKVPRVAFQTRTPWTSPWRIIALGSDREGVAKSQILGDLAK